MQKGTITEGEPNGNFYVQPFGPATSARTCLTAFSKSLSLDVAIDNITINNLLPERLVKLHQITYEEARQRIINTIAAKRMGTSEEFADACAFLCSAQAGFISGQNLQLDGGSYPGLI
jgi:3-oxoacyl-[acyl-carrier protein] reductase